MVFFAEFELCDPRRTRLAPMSGRTRRYSERSPSLDGIHEYQHWTGRCATPPLSLSGLSISPTHGSASDGRPLRATRRPSFSDGGAFTPRAVASACMTPPNAGDERRAPSDGALGATMPSPIERKHDIAKRRRRVQCHGDAGASGSPRRSPSKAAALRRACEPDEGEPCSAQQPHHHQSGAASRDVGGVSSMPLLPRFGSSAPASPRGVPLSPSVAAACGTYLKSVLNSAAHRSDDPPPPPPGSPPRAEAARRAATPPPQRSRMATPPTRVPSARSASTPPARSGECHAPSPSPDAERARDEEAGFQTPASRAPARARVESPLLIPRLDSFDSASGDAEVVPLPASCGAAGPDERERSPLSVDRLVTITEEFKISSSAVEVHIAAPLGARLSLSAATRASSDALP